MVFWASDRYTSVSKSLYMHVNFLDDDIVYLFTAATKFMVVVQFVTAVVMLKVYDCCDCADGFDGSDCNRWGGLGRCLCFEGSDCDHSFF
jgi:hypothetical protein